MQQDDLKTPATKGDLLKLKNELKSELQTVLKEDLIVFKDELKEDLIVFKTELKHEILTDIKQHFDMTVETIRHDLHGANRDEIEVMKDRVTRLEKHTGLPVAA